MWFGHHHKKILGNKISCLPASPYERITHSHNSTTLLESKLPSYISLYLWLYFKRMLRTFIHTWKSKKKEGEEGKRKGGGRGEAKEIYLCFTVIREGVGRRWCRWNRIAYESLFVEGGDKYTEVRLLLCLLCMLKCSIIKKVKKRHLPNFSRLSPNSIPKRGHLSTINSTAINMSSLEHVVKVSRVPEVYVPNNNNKNYARQ